MVTLRIKISQKPVLGKFSYWLVHAASTYYILSLYDDLRTVSASEVDFAIAQTSAGRHALIAWSDDLVLHM